MMLVWSVVTYACETRTLSVWDINNLLVFGRRILRKIYGPVQCKEGWRMRSNKELWKLIKGEYIVKCIIIIIIIIGTTAPFEPRPSSEVSASCPYSLQRSSDFYPPTSSHLPSYHLPILVSACPSVFFLLPLQPELCNL